MASDSPIEDCLMKKKGEKIEPTDAKEKDDKEQSRRFIETAKALETDESGKLFKGAIDSVKKQTKS